MIDNLFLQIGGRILLIVILCLTFRFLYKNSEDKERLKIAFISLGTSILSLGFWYFLAYMWEHLFIEKNYYLNFGFYALLAAPIICFGLIPALIYINKSGDKNYKSQYVEVCLTQPFIITFVSFLLMVTLLLEGLVCIIMVAPLVFLSSFIGANLAYFWKKFDKRKTQNLSMIFLIYSFPFLGQHFHNSSLIEKQYESVSSEIIIHATPSQIWPQVKAYSQLSNPLAIKHPIDLLFVLGVPAPQKAWIQCDHASCQRQCIFNQEVTFYETITSIQANKELTFNVETKVGQQKPFTGVDIHLMPGGIYYKSTKGQYRLEEIEPGVTRLSGTSWYTLTSSLNWYFNPWARYIIRGIHMKVFEHIKSEVEEL